MNHLISTKHVIIHGEKSGLDDSAAPWGTSRAHPLSSFRYVRYGGHGSRAWGVTPRLATREMLVHVSPNAIGPLDWPSKRAQRGVGKRYGPVSIDRYRLPVPLLGTYWPGFPYVEPDEPETPDPEPRSLVDEICALIAKVVGVPDGRI